MAKSLLWIFFIIHSITIVLLEQTDQVITKGDIIIAFATLGVLAICESIEKMGKQVSK